MKKVMLVDDEVVIRENIKNCIDWNKEGFIYCGDATDGEVALPLIEKWQPQILITDIKMPFMDGLELATIVGNRFPSIKTVILSGHDEFQYAQRAIQIGVEDYCLKPVGADDLVQLLHKISARIDAENKQAVNYKQDKFLADLCGGLISAAKAMETAHSFLSQLIASHYSVMIINCRDDIHTNLQQLEQEIIDLLNDDIKTFSYKKSRNEMVFVFCSFNSIQLQNQMEHINHHIGAKQELIVGIGRVYERIIGIHQSYLEAEDNKSLQKLLQQNKINIRMFIDDFNLQHMTLDRQKLITFIKLGNEEKLNSFIDEFCRDIENHNWNSSMYGFYLLHELTLESIQAVKQAFQIHDQVQPFIVSMQAKAHLVTNIGQCKQYIRILIEWLWQWRTASTRQYGELIIKVKLYIEENYNNNRLTLNDISKHVGVSPSHLSKIFSQEAKQTITEFITETRIKQAKELLKTTNQKTFEIAFAVGYQDQHYFSNTFKKVTGMTPIEFRKVGTIV